GVAPPPPPPAPVAPTRRRDDEYDGRDDDYDDREVRRPRRSRRDDYASHRGTLVMILGIGSLLSAFVSFIAYLLIFFAGIPVTVNGLVNGILAWGVGGKDLKRINAGRMDPDGKGTTQGGWICGIIGTILNGLALVCTCIGVILVVAFGVALFGLAAS